MAPVVSTTSDMVSFNDILNGDVLVAANPGPSGKWPLKWRGIVVAVAVVDGSGGNGGSLGGGGGGNGSSGGKFTVNVQGEITGFWKGKCRRSSQWDLGQCASRI